MHVFICATNTQILSYMCIGWMESIIVIVMLPNLELQKPLEPLQGLQEVTKDFILV